MGLVWLWFHLFHPLPSQAWADEKVEELAKPPGKNVESTQPNYTRRWATLYVRHSSEVTSAHRHVPGRTSWQCAGRVPCPTFASPQRPSSQGWRPLGWGRGRAVLQCSAPIATRAPVCPRACADAPRVNIFEVQLSIAGLHGSSYFWWKNHNKKTKIRPNIKSQLFKYLQIITFWSCSAARATKRLLSQMRDWVVGRSRINDELTDAS